MDAQKLGYEVSLFERLQRGGHVPRMLRTQYRMHPAIRAFPSHHFYQGALRDGERVLHAARQPAGEADGMPCFLGVTAASPGETETTRLAPYAFFNLLDGVQSRSASGLSLRNEPEARFCVRLLLGLVQAADRYMIDATAANERLARRLARDGFGADGGGRSRPITPPPLATAGSCCLGGGLSCPFGGVCGKVSVLTPYKEQKRALEAELSLAFGGKAWTHAVDVCSVDSYQGKEKEVVMYSCVRSGREGLGFVKDLRRLNVALTRARHALYVVGSESTLRQSSTWAALMDDVARRGLSRDVSLEGAKRVTPLELLQAIPVCLLDGTPATGVGGRGGAADNGAAAETQRSVKLVR